MSELGGLKGLLFACDCVSGRRNGYADPWASIAKNKLMPDGTKEEIVNLVAEEPKTISQIAERLKLSAPSVHSHVSDMIKSELLRESMEWERKFPAERYYEPNFPVVRADERQELETVCAEMSKRLAELFNEYLPQFETAFAKTSLKERGWEFSDLSQYLYACVQRNARQLLESGGILALPEQHRNGIEWVFWAEEPKAEQDKSDCGSTKTTQD
jgi:DNA-binding transcriptional ArsR family regulator